MTTTHEHQVDLDRSVTEGRGVVPFYQPVVDLRDGRTVGFEALARWPGVEGADPDRVFSAAARRGTTDQLDRSCLASAVLGADPAGIARHVALFVNTEAGRLGRDARAGLETLPRTGQADATRTVVLELTERHLMESPGDLLWSVRRVRDEGVLIALDDVGAHPDSLALLDLLNPDIVKLDLTLVQGAPEREQARTLAAVMAHVERTGAVVLAEGIETDAHLERALACGATLGQGWKFGEPARTVTRTGPTSKRVLRIPVIADEPPASPFDLAARVGGVRVAAKRWLATFSRHIESQADNPVDPPIVLSAMQTFDQFVGATRSRYQELARRTPLVAVFGADMPSGVVGHVRSVGLAENDPLRREWSVVALGAQTAMALLARETDDTGRAMDDRRFEFVITYDRAVVADAARSMLGRMYTSS